VVLAALLLVSMVPWVLYNQARPLVGSRSILAVSRADQYFTNRPGVRSAYEGAAGFLVDRGCARVGFASDQDGWEYPLRALLPGAVDIEHVDVANVSATRTASEVKSFDPCAVFAFGQAANMASIEVAGHVYQ